MAAAKEISVNAAVRAQSSRLDGVFTLKEKQRALKAFLSCQHVSALILTGFGKSYVFHRVVTRTTWSSH